MSLVMVAIIISLSGCGPATEDKGNHSPETKTTVEVEDLPGEKTAVSAPVSNPGEISDTGVPTESVSSTTAMTSDVEVKGPPSAALPQPESFVSPLPVVPRTRLAPEDSNAGSFQPSNSLPTTSLESISSQCALIQQGKRPAITGLLIREKSSRGGETRYFVVAKTSEAEMTIRFAVSVQGQVYVNSAERLTILPDQLSVYTLTTSDPLPGHRTSKKDAGTVHACQITTNDEMGPYTRQEIERSIARLEGEQGNSNPTGILSVGESAVSSDKKRDDERTLRKLKDRLEMPIGGVVATETGSAATPEELVAEDQSLLVDHAGAVIGLRHENRWVMLSDILEAPVTTASDVALKINGNASEVTLNCEITWDRTFTLPGCSLVGATTYELESLPGATLEERFSKVAPVLLERTESGFKIEKSFEWNGKPSEMKFRIFSERDDAPIIDEVVRIEHPGTFIAAWGKSPSPLIRKPKTDSDSPPDLVVARRIVTLPGEVLDLIPGSDGSMLYARTAKPPYWNRLHLESAVVEPVPWETDQTSLLATQAGRVYLLDPTSGVLRIYDEKTSTRLGLHVLPISGEIRSFAAPLESPHAPLIVANYERVFFLDPVNFEIIDNGLSLIKDFDTRESSAATRNDGIDPSTMFVRSNSEGTQYLVSGRITADEGARSGKLAPASISITVDRTKLAHHESHSSAQFISTFGRRLCRMTPDQRGGSFQLEFRRNHSAFPNSSGSIVFQRMGDKTYLELESLPVFPVGPEFNTKALPYDRQVYFDSKFRVIALPDFDRIHLLSLNLPEPSVIPPDFVFPGERFELPLPAGKDHGATSEEGIEARIDGNSAIFSVSENYDTSESFDVELVWTGELGTTLEREFKVPIQREIPLPVIESPNGDQTLALERVRVFPGTSGRLEFAGGGQIILTRKSTIFEARNLLTGETLFTAENPQYMRGFGDLTHVYVADFGGRLHSYDIVSGEKLAENVFLAPNGERSFSEPDFAAGISSTGPMMALIFGQKGAHPATLDPDTLKATFLDVSTELRFHSTRDNFSANSSGTIFWGGVGTISREGSRFVVKTLAGNSIGSKIDASGRFVSGDISWMDLGASPPKVVNLMDLPGVSGNIKASPDVSGKFLLITQELVDGAERAVSISVREMAKPSVELCKLRIQELNRSEFALISDLKRLVIARAGGNKVEVFKLDMNEILERFSGRALP